MNKVVYALVMVLLAALSFIALRTSRNQGNDIDKEVILTVVGCVLAAGFLVMAILSIWVYV